MIDSAIELSKIVCFQLDNHFMTEYSSKQPGVFSDVMEEAVRHTEVCGESMRIKIRGGGVKYRVSPFHAISYCVFLYWLSYFLGEAKETEMADQVYYLNKIINCVELYHAVKLPEIWYCEHPLGSVMGRAKYGDYFFFYQGCTVGGNFRHDGSIVYPEIGHHVKMLSNSKILGDCHIGDNVIISANAYIKDTNIPDNVIVFGESPNLVIKKNQFLNTSFENVLTL